MKKMFFVLTGFLIVFSMTSVNLWASNHLMSPDQCLACDVPVGLGVMNQAGTTATIKWNAVTGATSYLIEVENGTGNVTPFFFTQTITATSKIVSGLTPNKNYKFKVKTNCGTKHSNWSASFPFGSSSGGTGTCGAPTGLSAVNLTTTGAKLTWVAVPGATSYTVNVQNGSGNPNVMNVNYSVTTAYKVVSNLLPGLNYKFKVRAVCSGVTGSWTAYTNFTTPSARPGDAPSENVFRSIQLFPNPNSTGIYQIANEEIEEAFNVRVVSAMGQIVLEKQIQVQENQIDLSQFPDGLYFFQWQSGLQHGTERLVKRSSE
ncbi:MAG: fibronectin type III domain-containing protein [Bacteroidia bacterium]|nr:fibronectin type III domain-containing protein [Bacteroidia bacterium]